MYGIHCYILNVMGICGMQRHIFVLHLYVDKCVSALGDLT